MFRFDECIHASIYSSHKHVVGPSEQGTVLGTVGHRGKRQALSLLSCGCPLEQEEHKPGAYLFHSISIGIKALPSEPGGLGAQSELKQQTSTTWVPLPRQFLYWFSYMSKGKSNTYLAEVFF